MDSPSIRVAQLDDLEALTLVFGSASLSNEGDRQNLLANPHFLELSDAAVVQGRCWLAEISGVTVGFVTTLQVGDEVELEDLFVHPDWMRTGVGRHLIADVIERSRAAGASDVVVTANPHAMAFYQAVGFHGADEVATVFGPGTRMHLHL
jgi:N-acetylglutamate synthase-like GNAT family acetyltransferase